MVLHADLGSSNQDIQAEYNPIFGRDGYFQHNTGNGETYGAGLGYWKADSLQGFCVSGGTQWDWNQVRYRWAPNRDTAFRHDDTYRYTTVRPYIQAAYYARNRPSLRGGQWGFLSSGRISLAVPTGYQTFNNLRSGGAGGQIEAPDILDRFDPKGRYLIIQVNFQAQYRYRGLLLEFGPQINLHGNFGGRSRVYYKAPFSGVQGSLGYTLGWRKNQSKVIR